MTPKDILPLLTKSIILSIEGEFGWYNIPNNEEWIFNDNEEEEESVDFITVQQDEDEDIDTMIFEFKSENNYCYKFNENIDETKFKRFIKTELPWQINLME